MTTEVTEAIQVITIAGMKKHFGMQKERVTQVRKMLARLDYISLRPQIKGGQTYVIFKPLPETKKALVEEYRNAYWSFTPAQLLENAKSEVEQLQDEMVEWRENMEQSEGLAATDKFDEVQTTADALEYIFPDLEEVESELEESMPVLEDEENKVVVFYPFDPYLTERSGRYARAGNACAELNALIDWLKQYAPPGDIQDQVEALENIVSELENVEFPGMF